MFILPTFKRERRSTDHLLTLLLFGLAALPMYANETPNLLQNPGFEQAGANDTPTHWGSIDFKTGGQASWQRGDAHSGNASVALTSSDASQRVCWSQKVPVPANTIAVLTRGWYRTRSTAAAPRTGASYRVHFHRAMAGWDEIGLKQVFLPNTDTWTPFPQACFILPEGTEAVMLQVFHWLTPGETHWDDLQVTPITAEELPRFEHLLADSLDIDREPVPGRNLPYSPADGAVVSSNPPPFLWLPAPGSSGYELQVSPAATFPEETTIHVKDLQWCAEMLNTPLARGTWYWRYGARIPGKITVWSRARTFRITADAAPWPFPEPDAFTVPPTQPRLFVNPKKLGELRQRAATGDLVNTAKRLKQAVNRYAGEDLVTEPDWLPSGKDRTTTYATVFRTTRPPMDRMEQAAFAYLLTGDETCGAEAKRRLLHFFSWDPHGPTNVFHNDEPAMWIMMRGVRAYDWTRGLFAPPEAALVEHAMRERARDFYRKLTARPFENNPYESHMGRIIGFLGEAAIAFSPDWPEANTWLQYITKIYWGVYPAWGGHDGGWNEGPNYWSAYMSFALHFVVALREATGIDLVKKPFFRNTPYYRLYVTPPYSRTAPFGDGAQFSPSRSAALMYWFSTLLQDPVLRWYPHTLAQDGGDSILGVVLHDDSLQPRPPVHLPQARLFEGVGLVSLHTRLGDADQDVSFTMRSSPYGAVSHGHNDQNCFAIEAFAEPLAIASGHYNVYGSPHHDRWTRQTKAKCGITVDGGVGQDRGWQARGQISDFIHGDAFDLVRGDAGEAYGGRLTQAIRRVVHVRPGIFVILDSVAAETERTYEYWLHALDRMLVDPQANRVVITRPKARMITHFLAPDKLIFSQTDQFDPPPTWPPERTFVNNWHVVAKTTTPAPSGIFLTVLMPQRTDATEALPTVRKLQENQTLGCELRWHNGQRTIVAFALDESAPSLSLGELHADARTVALTLKADGSPQAWLLHQGHAMKHGDLSIVSSNSPLSSTAVLAPHQREPR